MKSRNLHKRTLSLLICLAILLPCFCGCTPDKTPPAQEQKESTDLQIFADGVGQYTLVLATEQSDTYLDALSILQNAFKRAFGMTLACAAEQVYSSSLADKKDLIFFGKLSVDHPAIDNARSLSGLEGFGLATEDGCVAFYASDDERLYDLAKLFADKYVKNEEGSLSIDKNITLSRSFKGYSNATHEKYCEFTLPVLSVDVAGKKPVTSKDIYLPASVSVSNTYSELVLNNEPAQIRGRGNGSWKYSDEKKPYKLKFDKKINLLGVGQGNSKDWVLLSNPFDYTELRNSITFTLAKEVFTGIGYCTDFQFVHLILSGQHMGIYLVCDQMENSSHKMDAKEDPDSKAASDYLIELDSYASRENENVENVDYFTLEGKEWLIKSDYNTAERCEYVRKRMERLTQAIKDGNEVLVKKLIDLDSFVDMYLLQEYMKNTDVGWSSFYMVLRSDGTLELTAPWDFDLSSGSDLRIDNGSYEGMHAGSTASSAHANPLFYLLIEQDFFYNAVCARWAEISEKAESVALEHIAYYSEKYREEFALDISKNYSPNSTHNRTESKEGKEMYAGNIEHLIDWLLNRRDWMNGYYQPRQ